jgi:hypothetical protein
MKQFIEYAPASLRPAVDCMLARPAVDLPSKQQKNG